MFKFTRWIPYFHHKTISQQTWKIVSQKPPLAVNCQFFVKLPHSKNDRSARETKFACKFRPRSCQDLLAVRAIPSPMHSENESIGYLFVCMKLGLDQLWFWRSDQLFHLLMIARPVERLSRDAVVLPEFTTRFCCCHCCQQVPHLLHSYKNEKKHLQLKN
jgi:hypothetical protein